METINPINFLCLPFSIEGAARCSFIVKTHDDQHCFISNSNLFAMLKNPDTKYHIVDRTDSKGRVTHWICIEQTICTFGFFKKLPVRF